MLDTSSIFVKNAIEHCWSFSHDIKQFDEIGHNSLPASVI